MVEEENILQLIIQKESWEEVLYHIVSLENLDPWNIDLVKLTERFMEYINKMEQLDFRIPAKIIFVAAILLRLKADYLSIFEEEEKFEEVEQKQKEMVDLGIDPELIKLGIPMKRMPKRQVTLDELIIALKKAMVVKERREERRFLIQQRLRLEVTEEDITKRIENMMEEIEELMRKMQDNKLKFRDVVKKWNRDEIVKKFIPMLHLDHNQKIECSQEDFFKEIYISRRNSPETK